MKTACRSRRFISLDQLANLQIQSLALPAIFILFGLIMGSWAGRIPALREDAQLSHSALSAVLLCGGLGAVLSYPISSRLMAHFGARTTILISGLALMTALVVIGNVFTVPLLMLGVLAFGIAASCYDVAMNAAATRHEKVTGKSEMSKLHGYGCGGGLAGTVLSSMIARAEIAPAVHFMVMSLPVGVALWLCVQLLDGRDDKQAVEKKSFSLPRGPLALLGVLGFLGAMSEGSIADWSGVFLKDRFDVTDGFAPLALAAFSTMMLLARLVGDRLKESRSARRLIRAGGVTSAAGLLVAVLAPNPYVALAGFAAAGMGLALVFPFVFSAAGVQGPMALSGVATMAYSGSLMGPPVVGALAQGMGMQAAIGFIALLSVVIAFVAHRAHILR